MATTLETSPQSDQDKFAESRDVSAPGFVDKLQEKPIDLSQEGCGKGCGACAVGCKDTDRGLTKPEQLLAMKEMLERGREQIGRNTVEPLPPMVAPGRSPEALVTIGGLQKEAQNPLPQPEGTSSKSPPELSVPVPGAERKLEASVAPVGGPIPAVSPPVHQSEPVAAGRPQDPIASHTSPAHSRAEQAAVIEKPASNGLTVPTDPLPKPVDATHKPVGSNEVPPLVNQLGVPGSVPGIGSAGAASATPGSPQGATFGNVIPQETPIPAKSPTHTFSGSESVVSGTANLGSAGNSQSTPPQPKEAPAPTPPGNPSGDQSKQSSPVHPVAPTPAGNLNADQPPPVKNPPVSDGNLTWSASVSKIVSPPAEIIQQQVATPPVATGSTDQQRQQADPSKGGVPPSGGDRRTEGAALDLPKPQRGNGDSAAAAPPPPNAPAQDRSDSARLQDGKAPAPVAEVGDKVSRPSAAPGQTTTVELIKENNPIPPGRVISSDGKEIVIPVSKDGTTIPPRAPGEILETKSGSVITAGEPKGVIAPDAGGKLVAAATPGQSVSAEAVQEKGATVKVNLVSGKEGQVEAAGSGSKVVVVVPQREGTEIRDTKTNPAIPGTEVKNAPNQSEAIDKSGRTVQHGRDVQVDAKAEKDRPGTTVRVNYVEGKEVPGEGRTSKDVGVATQRGSTDLRDAKTNPGASADDRQAPGRTARGAEQDPQSAGKNQRPDAAQALEGKKADAVPRSEAIKDSPDLKKVPTSNAPSEAGEKTARPTSHLREVGVDQKADKERPTTTVKVNLVERAAAPSEATRTVNAKEAAPQVSPRRAAEPAVSESKTPLTRPASEALQAAGRALRSVEREVQIVAKLLKAGLDTPTPQERLAAQNNGANGIQKNGVVARQPSSETMIVKLQSAIAKLGEITPVRDAKGDLRVQLKAAVEALRRLPEQDSQRALMVKLVHGMLTSNASEIRDTRKAIVTDRLAQRNSAGRDQNGKSDATTQAGVREEVKGVRPAAERVVARGSVVEARGERTATVRSNEPVAAKAQVVENARAVRVENGAVKTLRGRVQLDAAPERKEKIVVDRESAGRAMKRGSDAVVAARPERGDAAKVVTDRTMARTTVRVREAAAIRPDTRITREVRIEPRMSRERALRRDLRAAPTEKIVSASQIRKLMSVYEDQLAHLQKLLSQQEIYERSKELEEDDRMPRSAKKNLAGGQGPVGREQRKAKRMELRRKNKMKSANGAAESKEAQPTSKAAVAKGMAGQQSTKTSTRLESDIKTPSKSLDIVRVKAEDDGKENEPVFQSEY